MMTNAERAARAANELTYAVTDLAAEQYGQARGDYAIIIRAVNDSDVTAGN